MLLRVKLCAVLCVCFSFVLFFPFFVRFIYFFFHSFVILVSFLFIVCAVCVYSGFYRLHRSLRLVAVDTATIWHYINKYTAHTNHMHNTCYLYMMIVYAAWVTHIVHNSFSSFILHSPLSIFCITIHSSHPPSSLLCLSLRLRVCAFTSSFSLWYSSVGYTLYYLYAISLCRAVLNTP